MQELYADGGTIGPNPSPYGGTWCWVLVSGEEVQIWDSGIITPEDVSLPIVGNNLAETFAIMRAISHIPKGWDGMLYTDSLIALGRATKGNKFGGCPLWLKHRIISMRRGRKWNGTLLGGHPTKEELQQGKRLDGKPVSKWNVFCDEQCSKLAKEFLLRKGLLALCKRA